MYDNEEKIKSGLCLKMSFKMPQEHARGKMNLSGNKLGHHAITHSYRKGIFGDGLCNDAIVTTIDIYRP